MVSIRSHLARGRVAGFFRFSLCIFGFVSFITARAADTNALFQQWLSVQTNMQSWTADFAQTRTLKVLAQPLVAPGKVWVRRGEFRWELGQPAQTVVVRQPNQLLIMYPQLKRVEKYDLDAVPPGPVKDTLSLLDASLPRDRVSMEKQFRLIAASETNGVLQMALQPNSASARKFVGQVGIAFRTNDFSIAATEMKFSDGSILRNDFSNVVMNAPMADALFELKPPPDFKVVEPLRQ
jgi:outer membrane lipoprotein-sorting protein